MHVTATELPEVLIIVPKVFGDERGFFLESFNQSAFRDATKLALTFVQDNHSHSKRGECCEGCTIRSSNRRESSCALFRESFLTLSSTYENHRQISENGSVLSSQLKITGSFGCRPVLLTDLWSRVNLPRFCTRPPTTTRSSMSAVYFGMIRRSESIGRSKPMQCSCR